MDKQGNLQHEIVPEFDFQIIIIYSFRKFNLINCLQLNEYLQYQVHQKSNNKIVVPFIKVPSEHKKLLSLF